MHNSGEDLIFFICTHRTGSTLLQQMLASHTDIHTTASPWLSYFLMYGLRNDNGKKPIGIEAEYDAEIANLNLDLFLKSLPGGHDIYYEAVRKAALHMYGAAMKGTGKKYFLEKNVRHYLIVPELMKTFPKAKFIFIVRNPMAQFTGIIKWFKTDWRLLRKRYIDFHNAHFLIRDGIKQFSDRASVVRFEDLVSHPEPVLRKLCDELNIEYQDMTNYGQRIESMSNYQIVGMGDATSLRKHTKPVKKFIDDWPQFLDTSQKVYYAKSWLSGIGEELFSDLGYSFADAMQTLDSKHIDEREIHATWDLISEPELSAQKTEAQKAKDLANSPPPRVFKIKQDNTEMTPSAIIAVWECRYGINKGNKLLFHPDGTFEHFFLKRNGSITGNYSIDESLSPHTVDMEISQHHAGNEGTYLGIFSIENNMLAIAYGAENEERVLDISKSTYWYQQ